MIPGRLWFHKKESKIAENHTVSKGTMSVCAEARAKGKHSYSIIPPESQWRTVNAGIQTDIHEPASVFLVPVANHQYVGGGRGVSRTRHYTTLCKYFSFVYFNMTHFEFVSGGWYELKAPFSSPLHNIVLCFSLISLSESGKSERLPQNNFFDVMETHNVVNPDKEICTH